MIVGLLISFVVGAGLGYSVGRGHMYLTIATLEGEIDRLYARLDFRKAVVKITAPPPITRPPAGP
jgi:uncharacterized membrane protein